MSPKFHLGKQTHPFQAINTPVAQLGLGQVKDGQDDAEFGPVDKYKTICHRTATFQASFQCWRKIVAVSCGENYN